MYYKNEYRKQLKNDAEVRDGLIDEFFDESKSVIDRLSAFEKAGTINDKKHVKKALTIMRNTNENKEIRSAALKGIVNELVNNEGLIDEVISIIKDKSAPAVLRNAALSVSQINTIGSSLFMSKMPAYIEALRSVIDDDDKLLRETAMEYLALNNDEYVQRRLIEGLNDPGKEIIRPEVAIQLLAYDLHADYFPTLRRIVENPPNLLAKREALRNLAADADSKDLLIKTLEDKTEDPEIRHVCAVALQSLNNEYLQPIAKELILDENEDDELKAALLNTLTYTDDPKKIDEDKDFQKKLDITQKQSNSLNLKKVYSQFKSDSEK